jgi:YD repeat-containing protein
VATPNSSFNGNASTDRYTSYGDYSITTTEAAKIKKMANSKADTSATFYFIDLDGQTIYSVGYGADIDRTIPYKASKYYTVTFNLTNATSSNTSVSVEEHGDFITTLTMPNENYQWGTVTITMGGVDITDDVWKESTGRITISWVTGNIVITAVANEPLVTETITPYIAPRSTWYNGFSSGKITLNSSNMEGALGVSTANSYPYTDRNSKTFYLMPIGSQYCKATLNYSATDGHAVRYYLQAVKDNGGTFTSVATVGTGTNNVITWEKGTADYLLISIEHTDGATKWDWNSAGKTITVTFSNQ